MCLPMTTTTPNARPTTSPLAISLVGNHNHWVPVRHSFYNTSFISHYCFYILSHIIHVGSTHGECSATTSCENLVQQTWRHSQRMGWAVPPSCRTIYPISGVHRSSDTTYASNVEVVNSMLLWIMQDVDICNRNNWWLSIFMTFSPVIIISTPRHRTTFQVYNLSIKTKP